MLHQRSSVSGIFTLSINKTYLVDPGHGNIHDLIVDIHSHPHKSQKNNFTLDMVFYFYILWVWNLHLLGKIQAWKLTIFTKNFDIQSQNFEEIIFSSILFTKTNISEHPATFTFTISRAPWSLVCCCCWAEDDPFFLTLKIRYQKDQTYYGQPYYCPSLAWLHSQEQETLDTISPQSTGQ